MKKLVELNVVCNGSTGKIMCDIAKEANKNGYETYCFFGRGKGRDDIYTKKINNKISVLFHVILARLGFNGHGSYFATKKLVREIRKIEPDIIHMHNIHGYWINLKVLFNYLKNEYKGKIVWTLHDCWAFTGHCSYFTYVNCQKWQKECFKCPALKSYPKEFVDTTKKEYELKKELFIDINNLTIVTPSLWLSNLVKKSFLKDYRVEVINNGINLDIFKFTKDESIYKKYNIPKDKKIILGVANSWEERKGLNDFLELNNIIDNSYQIVLVGIDNSLKKIIPKNIVCIKRTDNQIDLASIYTIATVLFIPTYEDNYPTVILESIACNTPIVAYDTGGCKEAIHNYGKIISYKDNKSLLDYCENNLAKNYIKRNEISKEKMYEKYMKLYKK